MPAPLQSVLVAEDNLVLSRVLKFNLEQAGYKVLAAQNGAEAAEKLRKEPVDLLITDFQMPKVSGGELCRIVRQELGLFDLPIVMCSAKGLELDVGRLRAEYNLAHMFFKPFSVREIVAVVGELLAGLAAASRDT